MFASGRNWNREPSNSECIYVVLSHPVLSCVFQESNCLVFRATADQCDTWTTGIPSYIYIYIHIIVDFVI